MTIADILDTISNRLARLDASLAKLRRLKAGLMQDLLTGRVPVTPLLAQPQPAHAAA